MPCEAGGVWLTAWRGLATHPEGRAQRRGSQGPELRTGSGAPGGTQPSAVLPSPALEAGQSASWPDASSRPCPVCSSVKRGEPPRLRGRGESDRENPWLRRDGAGVWPVPAVSGRPPRPGRRAATPASDRAARRCRFAPSSPRHTGPTPPRGLGGRSPRPGLACSVSPGPATQQGLGRLASPGEAYGTQISILQLRDALLQDGDKSPSQPPALLCGEGHSDSGVLLPPIPGREGKESWPCPRRGASYRETGLISPGGRPPA